MVLGWDRGEGRGVRYPGQCELGSGVVEGVRGEGVRGEGGVSEGVRGEGGIGEGVRGEGGVVGQDGRLQHGVLQCLVEVARQLQRVGRRRRRRGRRREGGIQSRCVERGGERRVGVLWEERGREGVDVVLQWRVRAALHVGVVGGTLVSNNTPRPLLPRRPLLSDGRDHGVAAEPRVPAAARAAGLAVGCSCMALRPLTVAGRR